MKLDLLVASGGVLSHAPRMSQTAAMLIDAFEPEGFTTLAKDSIFMMPHLGVLAEVHERAALEVFERDCLIYLGTCVAPAGLGRAGRKCFSYEITGGGLNERGEMAFGDMRLFPLTDAYDGKRHCSPGARVRLRSRLRSRDHETGSRRNRGPDSRCTGTTADASDGTQRVSNCYECMGPFARTL